MGNKLILALAMILACGAASAWEIEDINGTWVDDEGLMRNNPRRIPKNYYWGRGSRIVDSTLEFDLEPKTVAIPGMGLYFIDAYSKDEEGAICLVVFYVGDKEREFPLTIRVAFIDSKRARIACYPQEGWWKKALSPEENWVWYRLSGPPQKVPAAPPTPPASDLPPGPRQ